MISSSVFTGTRSPCAGEVAVDVVLEAAARARALRAPDVVEIDARRIDDDRRPARFRSSTRRHEDLDDLRIGRVALVGLAQDADARALQAVLAAATRVVREGRGLAAGAEARAIAVSATVTGSSGSSPAITWNTATASSTVRVIGPAMSARRLSGTTPARLVRPIVERMPASAWCDDGTADRVAGVAAEADRAEVGGDGRRGAAARAGGDAIERVRILRVAGQDRADRLVRAERELRHVRLGEDDRAGVLDALDLERVAASRRSPSAPASPPRSAGRWSRSCP